MISNDEALTALTVKAGMIVIVLIAALICGLTWGSTLATIMAGTTTVAMIVNVRYTNVLLNYIQEQNRA